MPEPGHCGFGGPIGDVGDYGAAPDDIGQLEATTLAIGYQLARLAGRIVTRLARPFGPTDTEAHLESASGLATAGRFWIHGELVTYEARTETALLQCARETGNLVYYADEGRDTWPVGTPVYDGRRKWSLVDQCCNAHKIREAEGDALEFLAEDRQAPRPFGQLTEENLRDYIRARWGNAGCTWRNLFNILRPLFQWAEVSGADGAVVVDGEYLWLATPQLTSSSRLHDRWLYVAGRLCRIIRSREVDGVCQVRLEPAKGRTFEAHGLVAEQTGLAYTLVPFRMVQDVGGMRWVDNGGAPETWPSETVPAATFHVYLYLSTTGLPYTYLSGDHEITTDGRPLGGKVLTDESVSGTGRGALYMIRPFVDRTVTILEEYAAAGVFIRATLLAP